MSVEVEATIEKECVTVEIRSTSSKAPTVQEVLAGLRTVIISMCDEYGIDHEEYKDVIDGFLSVKSDSKLN